MTNSTKEQVKRALAGKAGEHMGDIVWPEISDVDNQKYERSAIGNMLDVAGLPRTLIADQLSAQAALGRARNEVNGEYDGYTIATARKRDTSFHVFRTKGDGAKAVKVTCHVLTVNDRGHLMIENTEQATSVSFRICDNVKERFAHHNAYATHRDVGRMVVKGMRWLNASRLRRSGSLFWVSKGRASHLRAFADVIEKLGHCELVAMPVYDTPESKAQAGRAVKASLASELDDIQVRLTNLRTSNNTTRTGTVERKLAEISEVELRVESLVNILGKRAVTLREQLAVVQADAAKLLTEVESGTKSAPTKRTKAKRTKKAALPKPEAEPVAPRADEKVAALDNESFD